MNNDDGYDDSDGNRDCFLLLFTISEFHRDEKIKEKE